MADSIKESDLYEPVYTYLSSLGFTVKSEVKDCDIVAQKEGQTVIVELKKSFQMKLLYQAIERQKICERVYIAIPRPKKGAKDKNWKNMVCLIKRLHLGFLTVALDSPGRFVDVVLEPEEGEGRRNKKKEEALKKEFSLRSGEYNKGGVNRKKIATAYREKSIALACVIEKKGEVSLKTLKEMGFEDTIGSVLRANYYHWFLRKEKGVYQLSEKGKQDLELEEFQSMISFYRKKYASLKEENKEESGI